jgi:hypothetical protein
MPNGIVSSMVVKWRLPIGVRVGDVAADCGVVGGLECVLVRIALDLRRAG